MDMNSIDRATVFQEQNYSNSERMSKSLSELTDADLTRMTNQEKMELREKTQEVETLFVKMMLDQMRKSVKPESSGSAAEDQGKDIYQEMLYNEYAKSISSNGGIGIAKLIYDQLTTPKISAEEAIARYNKNQSLA
jgi:flagellar protein FlgJ